MKEYSVIIMSVDYDEDPEDNHQKYRLEVEASSVAEAEKKGKEKFSDEYPGYPIYWLKVL